MSDANFPEWQIELDASKLKFPLEYSLSDNTNKKRNPLFWFINLTRNYAQP